MLVLGNSDKLFTIWDYVDVCRIYLGTYSQINHPILWCVLIKLSKCLMFGIGNCFVFISIISVAILVFLLFFGFMFWRCYDSVTLWRTENAKEAADWGQF